MTELTETLPDRQSNLEETLLFDRMDGSFLHPAPFTTAANCIRFWSSIQIPDAIIDQFASDYLKIQDEKVGVEMRRLMHAWESSWLTKHPKPSPGLIPAWEFRYDREREERRLAILPDVKEANIVVLGEYDVPQFIRAAQMWTHAPHTAFGDEQGKVGSHRIELFAGSMTVDEIEAKYEFNRIRESLRRVRGSDTSEKLLAVLNNIDDGITQILGGVAE